MSGISFILVHVYLVAISQAILLEEYEYEISSDSDEDLPDLRNSNVQGRVSNSHQECSCTYDYSNGFLKARVGHRLLEKGDSIIRGETVSFECRYVSSVLTWENGLRFYGRANMTCNTCEKWQKQHLPTCRSAQQYDVVLGHEDDLAVLPGGTVQLQTGQNHQFSCNNIWRQPEWVYSEKDGVSVQKVEHIGERESIFVSYLDITFAKDEHSGIYECFSKTPSGYQTLSTFLHIEVVRKSENDGTSSSTTPKTGVSPVDSTVSTPRKDQGNENNHECVCIYVPGDTRVKAFVGDKMLEMGDTVRHGETVSFQCVSRRYVLSWENGLPYQGNARMTCSKCQIWTDIDLPTCHLLPRRRNSGTSSTATPEIGVSPIDSTTSTPRKVPDDGNNRECVCIYDSDGTRVKAFVGEKMLEMGDTVRHGETVSFQCASRRHALSWENGLRYQGKARMTCSKCQIWTETDLPTCRLYPRKGHILISSKEELSFLPGGILQMREGESHNISCVSTLSRPLWKYETKENVAEWTSHGLRSYHSHLEIKHVKYEHKGKYECISPTRETVIVLTLEVEGKPTGSANCSKFPDYPGLRVDYTGFSVGSIALFRCSPSSGKMSGSSNSTCLGGGTWSNPAPMCEAPKCSIDDLVISLPEDVTFDLRNVIDEFSPGSQVQLVCENFVMEEDSKAVCGEHGRWKVGDVKCVPGCRLDINPSSKLLVEPMKDNYRIGEFVFLSCPRNYQLSNDVERLMCLRNVWSHHLPECIEERY